MSKIVETVSQAEMSSAGSHTRRRTTSMVYRSTLRSWQYQDPSLWEINEHLPNDYAEMSCHAEGLSPRYLPKRVRIAMDF